MKIEVFSLPFPHLISAIVSYENSSLIANIGKGQSSQNECKIGDSWLLEKYEVVMLPALKVWNAAICFTMDDDINW